MIDKYLRFSTDKQDEIQQENTIDKYLENIGIKADAVITDAGVSGGVSYDKRNLGELCNSLKPNDVIVVSELSRLTRGGIGELTAIIENHFKPNQLRLIICNVGLDVNCSNLNPIIELQLAMMATFAKIEKMQIQQRTKSALDARKKMIKENGSFVSKKGNRRTRLGGNGDMTQARLSSAEKRNKMAKENSANKFLIAYINQYEAENGELNGTTPRAVFDVLADRLNALGQTTSTGLPYNTNRLRVAWARMKKLYV